MKSNYHIVIVVSEFNKPVTNGLLDGAKRAFKDCNGEKLSIIKVPGAFEIPATTKMAAKTMVLRRDQF